MPLYAGKVDCVFIDPPYNTGNEGWCYNDNVNAPMIKEWLDSNPVGIEDGLRHDKWCAMMWPRVRLLLELLADEGLIFVTIDNNEQHHLRCLLDEVFGESGFIAEIAWQKSYSPSNDAVGNIGAALFHMATNRALDPATVREDEFYLGKTEGQHVWLIYRPDLEWLKTPEAALTLTRAKAFTEIDPEKRHLVFAPARYVSQKMLAEQNIPVEFVPLPFALYRIDRS